MPHLQRARPDPPPPYTFSNETFKAEGSERPVSAIYDTIEDNPYQSITHNPDMVDASSGYNRLQDVTPPEKSNDIQAAGETPHVSPYQMKVESELDDKNDDYIKPLSYIPDLPPKKKKIERP